METATWVLTCRYWFSISRMTCLIIFSGSSARSIRSFRFARINVPTRSKSAMRILLSEKLKPAARSGNKTEKPAAPAVRRGRWQNRELQKRGDGMRHRRNRTEAQRGEAVNRQDHEAKKVAQEKRNGHREKDPQDHEFFLDRHVQPPKCYSASRWALACPTRTEVWLRLLRGRLRRLLRIRRFVADQPHLAEELRHLHAGECFEERGNLRRYPGDVARELVCSGGIAIAGGHDGDLVHFAERLSERADDIRQAGDELVDDGGLVVFLVGLGLNVHGAGFGFALLEDDLGFGFTLRTDGRGPAFGFAHQALAFGVGKRLDALTLDFRLLEDGGDQFAFAARDLGFLHFHLSFALDLLDFNGLGNDLLLLDVGFDFVSLVCLRLGFFRSFKEVGFLDVEVALGFGLLGHGSRFRGHTLLIGLRLGDGGGTLGFRALDGDVAVSFGGGHFGVAL